MTTRAGAVGVAVAAVMAGVLSTLTSNSIVTLVVIPILVGLISAELDRSGGRVAVAIVRTAALMLPVTERHDHADEWADHVLCEGTNGLRPLVSAISIALLAAPLLAVLVRHDAARRFPVRTRLSGATMRVIALREYVAACDEDAREWVCLEQMTYALEQAGLRRGVDDEAIEVLEAFVLGKLSGAHFIAWIEKNYPG